MPLDQISWMSSGCLTSFRIKLRPSLGEVVPEEGKLPTVAVLGASGPRLEAGKLPAVPGVCGWPEEKPRSRVLAASLRKGSLGPSYL